MKAGLSCLITSSIEIQQFLNNWLLCAFTKDQVIQNTSSLLADLMGLRKSFLKVEEEHTINQHGTSLKIRPSGEIHHYIIRLEYQIVPGEHVQYLLFFFLFP